MATVFRTDLIEIALRRSASTRSRASTVVARNLLYFISSLPRRDYVFWIDNEGARTTLMGTAFIRCDQVIDPFLILILPGDHPWAISREQTLRAKRLEAPALTEVAAVLKRHMMLPLQLTTNSYFND